MTEVDEHTAAPTARWRWWVHLILIGGYFVLPIFFSSSRSYGRPALTGSVPGMLSVSTINVALFALVLAIGWAVSRASREDMLLPWRPGWAVLPLGLGYSIAFRIALGVIVTFVVVFLTSAHVVSNDDLKEITTNSAPQVERLVSIPAMKHNRVYFWLMLTFESFIVAGLREEMWRSGTLAGMRALWPRLFSNRSGEMTAVVIVAVFFGAAHYQMGVIAAVLAFLLGIFLGAIMVIHRSIWPAVFAHGFFDATSFALLPYAVEKLHHLQTNFGIAFA